jgi:hypothetical protein
MKRQNITISLPTDILKKAKHLAVEQGSSVSGLLAAYVECLVDEARERERAAGRIRRRLASGLDLGTRGEISWTREDLHAR